MEACHLADVWGGMGSIQRITVRLRSGRELSFVAKLISMPQCVSEGDKRKRDSYVVEANFYELGCAVQLQQAGVDCPQPLLVERSDDDTRITLCMSELEGQQTGYMSERHMDAALAWLARLHGMYWGCRADEAVSRGGLQPQGCYWYLDTRRQEYERMPDDGWMGRLRLAATGLDARLKADCMQAVVHGDAKPANMLFRIHEGVMRVGYCDFQYTGKACPAKDLAYCLLGADDRSLGDERLLAYLTRYLELLAPVLTAHGDEAPTLRQLHASYCLAMCDFARWMAGWGWCGMESTMRRLCSPVLDQIDGGTALASEAAYQEAIFAAFPL